MFLSGSLMVLDGDLWRPFPYVWREVDSIVDFHWLDAARRSGTSTVLIPVIDPATDELALLSMDVLAVLEQRTVPVGPIEGGSGALRLPGRRRAHRQHAARERLASPASSPATVA